MSDDEERQNAGGAAASGGVEFQQRLGAYFAVAMIRQFDLAPVLELPATLLVNKVSFETGAAVDDLTLWTDRAAVFIQAKRSIALSTSPASAMASVMMQFVRQWRADPSVCCVLATGPRASRKVTQELRKLLVGVRHNPGLGEPMTKSEKEVWSTFRSLADTAHETATGAILSDDNFLHFAASVRVLPFDVETGGTDERTALALLSGYPGLKIAPVLLWSHLVLIALRCATARQSLGRGALEELTAKWVELSPDDPALEEDRLFAYELPDRIPSGIDVVFATTASPKPPEDIASDVFAMQMRRFDPDGSRRVQFTATQCMTRNGMTWDLIVRGSTMKAIERHVDEEPERWRDRKIGILESNFDTNPNDDPAALAHEAHLKREMRRQRFLRCVRCALPVGEASPLLVEVDEQLEPSTIGLVHKKCHRPSHRVLGRAEIPLHAEHSQLGTFDLEGWAKALRSGGGLIRSELPLGASIGWNSTTRRDPGRTKAVQMVLADGSARPITHRMQVQRFTREEAEQAVHMFRLKLREAAERKDPHAVALESGAFSTYSKLLAIAPGDSIVLVDDAQQIDCTVGLVRAYSAVTDFYAPLMILRVGAGRDPFKIHGYTVFLSDPLRFDRFLANWRAGGINPGDFSPELVASDAAFDSLMHEATRTGAGGVLDPLVDLEGAPAAGRPIGQLPDREPSYV